MVPSRYRSKPNPATTSAGVSQSNTTLTLGLYRVPTCTRIGTAIKPAGVLGWYRPGTGPNQTLQQHPQVCGSRTQHSHWVCTGFPLAHALVLQLSLLECLDGTVQVQVQTKPCNNILRCVAVEHNTHIGSVQGSHLHTHWYCN